MRDIHLIPYTGNSFLFWGRSQQDYKATFKNSEFIKDAGLMNSDGIKRNASVDISGVHGVRFTGCNWEASSQLQLNETEFPQTALLVFDGSFKLLKDSLGGVNNSFQFYPHAIDINASTAIHGRKNIISHTNFRFCRAGIRIQGAAQSIIANNSFYIPKDPPSHTKLQYDRTLWEVPYGIYTYNAPLTVIEENQLRSWPLNLGLYSPNDPDAMNIGMVINNGGETVNIPYNNQFITLTRGVEAYGNNRNFNGSSGLQLRCNDFSNCKRDINVAAHLWPLSNNGIRKHQGDPHPQFPSQTQTEDLAGNIFSHQTGNDYWNHLFAPGIQYHHHDSATTPPARPLIFGKVNPLNYAPQYNKSSACPPNLLILASQDTLPEYDYPFATAYQDFQEQDEAIDSLNTLLDSLIDGGNTWELEAQIYFASTEQEYYDLYVDLMNESPYVSTGVLEELIMMEDFPDMMLRNVLVANPHAPSELPLPEMLYEYHPDILASYVDDIMAGTKTLGAKELLEARVSYLITKKEVAGREVLMRLDSLDNETQAENYMEEMLQNPYVNDYAYLLADYYYSVDRSVDASSVLGDITTHLQQLGDDDMMDRDANLQDWFDWRSLRIEGETYYDTLTPGEVTELEAMTENFDYSGAWARAFLEYNSGLYHEYKENRYRDYIIIDEEDEGYKRAPTPPTGRANPVLVRVYPNPAGDYTTLEGPELLTYEEVQLQLHSLDGRLIDQRAVKLPYLYELSGLPPGTYLLRYSHRGEAMGHTKLIKR